MHHQHDDDDDDHEPEHDATGLVWGSLLGLLVWPVVVILSIAAAAVLL
jgi:hypothetical protein